jgi:hypothetical protein
MEFYEQFCFGGKTGLNYKWKKYPVTLPRKQKQKWKTTVC